MLTRFTDRKRLLFLTRFLEKKDQSLLNLFLSNSPKCCHLLNRAGQSCVEGGCYCLLLFPSSLNWQLKRCAIIWSCSFLAGTRALVFWSAWLILTNWLLGFLLHKIFLPVFSHHPLFAHQLKQLLWFLCLICFPQFPHSSSSDQPTFTRTSPWTSFSSVRSQGLQLPLSNGSRTEMLSSPATTSR